MLELFYGLCVSSGQLALCAQHENIPCELERWKFAGGYPRFLEIAAEGLCEENRTEWDAANGVVYGAWPEKWITRAAEPPAPEAVAFAEKLAHDNGLEYHRFEKTDGFLHFLAARVSLPTAVASDASIILKSLGSPLGNGTTVSQLFSPDAIPEKAIQAVVEVCARFKAAQAMKDWNFPYVEKQDLARYEFAGGGAVWTNELNESREQNLFDFGDC
jgi:hypothetical protein